MYAGIDIGYDSTKVASGERRAAFRSVSGTPERSRFSLNGSHNGDIRLVDEGQTWLVGDAAVTHSRFLHRREDPGWFRSADYRRLLLAGLAQLTAGTAVRLQVVTGLPVATYEQGKDEVRALFLGSHRVELEGRPPQRLEVTACRVIPQPFGTVLSLALSDAGRIWDRALAEGPVGVIDIGGKTTNLLSVAGFSEVSRETTSLNAGAWDAVRAVGEHLAHLCPELELRDHQLMDALRERAVYHYGQRIDLAPVVAETLDRLAGTVIGAAGQLWGNGARLRAILLSGGGAHLLGERLRAEFRHARLAPEPRFANASGYYKLAVFLGQQG